MAGLKLGQLGQNEWESLKFYMHPRAELKPVLCLEDLKASLKNSTTIFIHNMLSKLSAHIAIVQCFTS